MKRILMISGILIIVLNSFVGVAKEIVTVVVNDDINYTKWINLVKKDFESANPDLELKIIRVMSEGADYHTKLAMMLRADDSVDAVWLDSFQFYNFASGNLITPLPELQDWDEWKNFYPSVMENITYKDKIYGIPITTVVVGLFYNNMIFQEAGIPTPWKPKTWNDIYETAEIIKQKVPEVWPFSFDVSVTGETSTFKNILMFIYGSVDDRLYKNGKWVISSNGILDSFSFIQKIVKDDLTTPRSVLFDKDQYKIPKKYMPEQKIGIRLDGCWIQRYWIGNLNKTNDYYSFAPMPTQNGQEPGYVTTGGSWMFTINSKSKKKDAALRFIKFAGSFDNVLRWSQIMFDLSPRKDVATSDEYPQSLKQFSDYIQYTRFRPHSSDYPIVSTELRGVLQTLILGFQTPEQAMDAFATNTELTLGKDKIVREK